jgi:dTDP-4-amino-4,6-dideoxygalactose transaminase
VKHALAVNSGTAALHTALAASGVGVGDEAIVPPLTFISTASSVLMQNAIPVFADVEPQTGGLDPDEVRREISARTRAVIVVHMNGYPADMDGLLAVAREHSLILIEDCAHAHGAEHKGRKVGSLGDIGIFSFQQKKNLSIGEGGLLITDNDEYAEKASAFRTLGDDPIGYNYRMPELHGAIGRVRLARLDDENARRIENAALLDKHLHGLPGIQPQKPREETRAVYYNYVVKYNREGLGVPRERFVEALRAEGIPVPGNGLIYYPLYRDRIFQLRDPYGGGCPFSCPHYEAPEDERPRYEEGMCPVTEKICDEVNIELKIHPPATAGDMSDIAAAFAKVIENIDELR